MPNLVADKDTQLALAKFAVIAPMVCRSLTQHDERVVRKEILAGIHEFPGGKQCLVPDRTLRSWLSRYRKTGFDGLKRPARKDRGFHRIISNKTMERAKELRQELPSRSVRRIMEILRMEGFAVTFSAGTLQRCLRKCGLGRQFAKEYPGTYQRWQQSSANDLWQWDVAVGPFFRHPEAKLKTANKLVCIVDDASRLCVHAEFYQDEQVESLFDCLEKAIKTFGKPRRLLCDNGPAFRSNALALACAQLGIELSFCRPFSPSSKGKIERFIRSIKDDLYPELCHKQHEFDDLQELNKGLDQWTESYNHRIHSALEGLAPYSRWMLDVENIDQVDDGNLSDAFVFRHTRKVAVRTGLIELMGRQYQAAPLLAGQLVEIRHRPCFGVPPELEVWHNGAFVELAVAAKVRTNVDFERLATMRSSARKSLI